MKTDRFIDTLITASSPRSGGGGPSLKKNTTATAVVALAASIILASLVAISAPRPDTESLQAYWPFDEEIGSTADDLVASLDGTLSGGMFGNALEFNNSDFVEVSDDPSLTGMSDITIEAWIKADISQPDKFSTILRRDSFGLAGTRTLYDMDLVNGKLRLTFIDSAGGVTVKTDTTTDLRDGAWHHVAVVRDDTTFNRAFGFVDGVKVIDIANKPLAITDVDITIDWTKTAGTCTAQASGPTAFHSETGFDLGSPAGNVVSLVAPGTYTGGADVPASISTTFDDAAAGSPGPGAPVPGTFTPAGSLSAFKGENTFGAWTLDINDTSSLEELFLNS